MNKHKTKFFKKVFESNADAIAILSDLPAMTEETFVPLMGEMWSKAKEKYRKRNERDAIAFANYMVEKVAEQNFPKGTWGEIYKIWKDE